jgi:hypothetical protein
MKTILTRAMSIGRATVFTVGLAVTLALIVGAATTALAAAPGDPFKLGKTNSINRLSSLVGRTAGFMLKIDNNGTGPALDLQVGPSTTPPANKTVAPMKVDSQAQVVNLNSDELDGKDSTDFARAYKRTVIVSPVPGEPAAGGTALLAALSGITDASQDNPYLLKIEPGTYDLGNSPLVMKQWVYIEGSGEDATKIRRSGSPNFDTGTVVASNKSGLGSLTVENTGGAARATAIWNEGATSFRLAHVTARASGGNTNVAVDTLNASPQITDVEAVASGGSGTTNYGLYNNNSSPTIDYASATVSGGDYNCAVCNRNSSSPEMVAVAATASGGSLNNGVSNNVSSSPIMTQIRAFALNGSNNYGVQNSGSSPVISNSSIRSSGGPDNRALTNANGVVQVDGSRLIAPPASPTVFSSGSATTKVGATLLDGGPITNIGSNPVTCAGVYDENYTFFASTCP